MPLQNLFFDTGNAGSDATIGHWDKNDGSGERTPYVKFSMKCVRLKRDREDENRLDDSESFWVDVTWVGDAAKAAAPMIRTGKRYAVLGEVRERKFVRRREDGQDEEGVAMDVRASAVYPDFYSIESIQYKPSRQEQDGAAATGGGA